MTFVVTAGIRDIMGTVADRIRWILERRGWTERELSRRAELPSPTHVGLILERGGERTGGETLAKISKAAGVDLAWLVTGEGDPEPVTHEDAVDHRPVNRNRRGWHQAAALALERWPREVDLPTLQLAGEARNLTGPEVATPEYVRDVCALVRRYATDDELERARRAAEMEAAIARDQEAFEAREREANTKPARVPKAPGVPAKPKRGGRG